MTERENQPDNFEVTLERGIANANSLQELSGAVSLFYDAGGTITTSGEVPYLIDQLAAMIVDPDTAPNQLTQKHGLRERFTELAAEATTDSQYEQMKPTMDEYLTQGFEGVTTQGQFFEQLQKIHGHLEEQEGDFRQYLQRLAEWKGEALRIQKAMQNEETLYPALTAAYDVFIRLS